MDTVLLSLVHDIDKTDGGMILLYRKDIEEKLATVKTIQDLVSYATEMQAIMRKRSLPLTEA